MLKCKAITRTWNRNVLIDKAMIFKLYCASESHVNTTTRSFPYSCFVCLFVCLIVVRTINMSEIYHLNKILSVQYSTVDCKNNVVQQVSKNSSSCLTKTLCLLISISLLPLSSALATTIPLFDSMNLTILDSSYKWNHTIFVFV